ncbi:hypothetical protein ABZZ79_34040 [Streptomyces sp. NPDC006458]|uniref:hypothetical protein n=1 Tax=Streptomyces sp. NPDC006458 TaxID=3154302 RepID=UPI0033A696EF
MSSRIERHAPTDASSLRTPHVMRSATLTLFVFAVLFAVVRSVGGNNSAWQATGWLRVIQLPAELFMQFVEGVARLVKAGSDGASFTARLGCLLLLIVLFVALRRWMLMYYAYKPGAVDVKRLVASAPDAEPNLEGLTAQFRKQLSETNLYPPTALPAEAPADNFLDLLGDVDLEPRKVWTSLLRLFSRLRPKIAYTVRGVLRTREQEPRFGITVTVTSYAIRGSRTEAIWGTTWDEAVQDAGYWVMASLVPVTRASRRPPWQQWRGRDLPPKLFAAYQQARELSSDRKFDDALDRYYEALRIDPTNLYLRTQIAGIQEQLWLHLDALETYYGAVILDGQTSTERNARMGMGSWDPRRIFRRRYRWWRSGLLEARFRYAVVLGVAERTANQWCRPEAGRYPRREHARMEIRKALVPALASRHWRILMGLTPPGETRPLWWVRENDAKLWLEKRLGEEERREEIVKVIFLLACREEMRQLADDYPRMLRILFQLRHPFSHAHGTLTRTSLRLDRDVWAPLRLAQVEDQGGYAFQGLENSLRWGSLSAEKLQRGVKKARGWLRMPRQWLSPEWSLWQDSYNAACVYAVGMNRFAEGDAEHGALADLAVEELENATHADSSGFHHPLMRSWLLAEDPDLEELRQTDHFIRFERETYPHASPDRHRPRRPVWPEMTVYDQHLLSGCAEVMEHTWRLRGKQLPVESHLLAQWFSGDAELWRCVHRIAENEGRHWRDREKLLQHVREIADITLLVKCGLPARLPEMDDLLDNATWLNVNDARKHVEASEQEIKRRLESMKSVVSERLNGSGNPNSPIVLSTQWLTSVRRNGASAVFVTQAAVRQVCRDYEIAWRALRDQVDPDEDGAALRTAMSRFHEPNDRWWRALAVIRNGGAYNFRRVS